MALAACMERTVSDYC